MADYSCPFCNGRFDNKEAWVHLYEEYYFSIGDPLYRDHDTFGGTVFVCSSCGSNVTDYIKSIYDYEGNYLIEEDEDDS